MKKGFLSEYFDGVVVKRLSGVEANLSQSNQHEFNGVQALKNLLGREKLTNCPSKFLWLGEDDRVVSEDSFVTWYDARDNHPTRSEFRLYFKSNSVMDLAIIGDLLIVARRPSGEIMIIIVSSGSTVENQLLWLFGVSNQIDVDFEYREFEQDDTAVDFATRYILEELGIEIEEPEADRMDALLEQFGGKFPKTSIFSSFVRATLPEVNPLDGPDEALLAWIEREEKLFRRLERHIVSDRLEAGFMSNEGADVDGFIQFSLSVQNRRKSRAGYALENHLEEVFRVCGATFDSQAVTENKSKPDFLFPGGDEYHNPGFPESSLTMLGVKSTCKDRWRQVLSEAARIPNKHLFTLEPGISENQTNEMMANSLQLVLPRGLHATYRENQQQWLWDLDSFITLVKGKAGT
ncbi:MAG: type II restriction endonuclease [Candidatus Reddybacter sp.]